VTGILITFAASHGIHIGSAAVVTLVTGAVVIAYTTLARFIEIKYPKIGKWLVSLGLATAQPTYVPPKS
jgi:hypothetical protein